MPSRAKSICAVTLGISGLLTGCTPAPEVPRVAERFITELDPQMNIDSVATHAVAEGEAWLFATAKDTHVIRIYDAATGQHVRDLGGPGSGPGEFQRPNGVLAADGMLIVIERDNRRVQI
ncbi:MAG: phytase, partial [Gammaproteobacteria bacterium]